jgi:hypothetical protein
MADGDPSVLTGMFSYMIANTDWTAVFFHNTVLIRTEDGRHVVVPYDFDHSGVVNARYARVSELLADRIRTVRQRLYRDFCRPQLTFENAVSMFAGKREQVEALYRAFPYYAEPSQAEDAIEYYEDFWKVLANEDEFGDEILDNCMDMPR